MHATLLALVVLAVFSDVGSGSSMRAMRRVTSSLAVTASLYFNIPFAPSSVVLVPSTIPAATADDYSYNPSTWTDRNALAAETWKAVDEGYLDRTFAGKDWFKLRQQVVKRSYASDEEVYAALRSMLGELGDPYTRYLSPAQYSGLVNAAMGELTGVGLELLGLEGGVVQVNNIAGGSPAVGSGLQTGDVIVNVDGKSTSGLSTEEVALLLRGAKGTKASLRVTREGGGGEALDFTIVRQPFKLVDVSSSKITATEGGGGGGGAGVAGKVGLISIRSFSSTTRDDVMSALEKFHKEGKLDALVVDMRNNGGGLLPGAIETSNLFLPPGKVVVSVINNQSSEKGTKDTKTTSVGGAPSQDTSIPDLRTPLFVLVNKNTASAAEVLAAALKENDRAVLVGERTFGKGIIQNLQEVRGGGGVAVTIAKYETPKGNDINKKGIDVDVNVACSANEAADACMSRVPSGTKGKSLL